MAFRRIVGGMALALLWLASATAHDPDKPNRHADRFEHYEGTRTCLECHEKEALTFFDSQHYQWRGGTPDLVHTEEQERLGKLTASGLVTSWSDRVGDIGATELAVTGAHALLAGSMRWTHRDPFDRLLVAQATIEAMALVTVDRALHGLPSPSILTW